MYNLRGEGITTAIAREILEPFGEISKCELLSVQIQEAMKLPQAVFVEFAAFDPKRDLNSVSLSRRANSSDRVFNILTFPHRPSRKTTDIASMLSM